MSKHLRFGRLFGLLVVMLTLNFAWAQGQNLSHEKKMLTFGFAAGAPNTTLTTLAVGTIDEAAKTIAVTVPYATGSTSLVATFTSSPFANVYAGILTPPALPNGTQAVSGVSPALSYFTGPVSYAFTSVPVVWTVEAENHSFENYWVTVTVTPASSAKDITLFNANYGKLKTCPGSPITVDDMIIKGAENITFVDATHITFNVNYGAMLDEITVYLSISPLATVSPVVATTGTAISFGNNDGTGLHAVTFTVTAQNGTTKVYTVTPSFNTLPSIEDYLLPSLAPTMGFTGAVSVVPNTTTQIIKVKMPYSTHTVKPTWVISDFAHMFTSNPQTNPSAVQICSGVPSFAVPGVYEFWIQAEDPTEVSMWQVELTNDVCSTASLLTGITAGYAKTVCQQSEPGVVVPHTIAPADITINSTLNTVTFKVPFGVTGVTVLTATVSPLAKNSTVLSDAYKTVGDTILVTSECGVLRTYTVALTAGAQAANKQLLSFGFDQNYNDGYSFHWPADAFYTTIDGEIDQVTKLISIKVPFITDLHTLKATFTSSDWSCVYIAESNLAYTLQTSEVTQNDFSNSLTYVVVAEDGTEDRYDVSVRKEAPGKNELLGFMVTVPYCFGNSSFTATGAYTATSATVTNILVSVRYGTTGVGTPYTFTASPWAKVKMGTTPLTPAAVDEDGVQTFTGTLAGLVTNFYVTSDNAITMQYIVTLSPRVRNSDAKLLTYKFTVAANSFGGVGTPDAVGVIDEAAKTVMVEIPWDERAKITSLIATFTLSPYAVMSHSEDAQVLQVSGTTPNDFTTPVAYTVWPEDCNITGVQDRTVEYFVTVKVKPYKNTDITKFVFDVDECAECPLINHIDLYARRIYITVPYSVDISDLAPSEIGLATGATISPAVGVKRDWTNSKTTPLLYTVTAPGGSATAVYSVIVENPPCKAHLITAFALPGIQVLTTDLVAGHGKPVTIDTLNHKVDVIIKKGANLKKVAYTRTISCGATICCLNGDCADNNFMDLSDGCHICVVTAEDETVEASWTICVHEIDEVVPKVETVSVMAYNCTAENVLDSVGVMMDYVGPYATSVGRVFIINEDLLNKTVSPWVPSTYNLADWTNTTSTSTSVASLVASRKGNWAAVTADNVDKLVYIKTNGMYSGTYWAFAVSENGKISCISTQKLFLDICEKDIATLCELQTMPAVWRYRITEEVFVTYEETRTGGNIKFVQDATCGIMIQDQLAALPTKYGEGYSLTNLIGTLVLPTSSSPVYKLVPVCCYLPTKSADSSYVAPIEMTYDEYYSECYGGNHYQSMLVKVTTPMIIFDDYHYHPDWKFDNLDLATTTARGDYDYFIQSVFNSPLIGKIIPTVPKYFMGIRTNVTWSGSIYGLFTPRRESDITDVTAKNILANPNPAEILGVLPGNCKSILINLYNEGVGDANITAVYLDDSPATDEFNLISTGDNAFTLPFTLGTWESRDIEVEFCPTNTGDESTNLIVEWGIGKTLVIPINGTTPFIFDMNYYQTFNCVSGNIWCASNDMNNSTSTTGWSATYGANAEVLVYSGWDSEYDGLSVHMRNRDNSTGKRAPVYMYTPGFNIVGADPVVSWMEATMAAYYSATDESPRNLWASTDMVNWTLINSRKAFEVPSTIETVGLGLPAGGYKKVNVSLSGYVGKTVWFKFEMLTLQPANRYTYWIVDNFAVEQRIAAPVIVASPNPGAFSGVQVGATKSIEFAVKNVGVSVLKIKSVSVSGAGFTLTDTNTYPIEVTDGPGTWAYTVGKDSSVVNFTVNFAPTDVGMYTGKVTVGYDLYENKIFEIPLSGEGLSCATATEAVAGENLAPSPGSWYKYTADKFQITTITTCDPRNTVTPYAYSFDSKVWTYRDCAGTFWSGAVGTDNAVEGIDVNDDMEANCATNRANSKVVIVMNEGETVYIFWDGIFAGDCATCNVPFYFHINPNYPIDGDVCETAIPLTLPVVNKFGTTVGFADDYNSSPCTPFSNYMDGNDIVYTITLPYEGYLTASLLGAYGSVHVLDMCPTEELEKFHCKASLSGAMGGSFDKKIDAGTYFVIVSTWSPPQTVDFLLNMSFRGTGVDDTALNNNLAVYPNPTNGKFTVSISNTEATDMIIELVNISGQVVYRNQVKAAYSYNEDIDATTFAKGVYYLKVNSDKGVQVEKVVVQ